MTAEERRGFRMACEKMALWAAQIERNTHGLGDGPLTQAARMVGALAHMLAKSTGDYE